MPAIEPWTGIEPAWRSAFELAWESFQEGSVPVGAVITDPVGSIVAAGRNRSFAAESAPGLGGTYIAHAEINALARLVPGEYEDHTIWSTLEPCFMCTAAIFHSHVGAARFAAADPLVEGVERLPELSRWVRSRWPERRGPEDGWLGSVAGLLHVLWHLRRKPDGVVIQVHRAEDPATLALVEQAATLETLADPESSLDDAITAIRLLLQ